MKDTMDPNLTTEGVNFNTFDYKPDASYSIETFEAINSWLKTNSFEIGGVPVKGFERDHDGHLIPIMPVPIAKEVAVAEISYQLSAWNRCLSQKGAVTGSQGGYLVGPGRIKAPDVAFTPAGICANLTPLQQFTFQGEPFSPTFVMELDDLTVSNKLIDLTSKIKDTYFPLGVQLAWLVDPVHKIFYVFKRTTTGVVSRYSRPWYNVNDNNPEPVVIDGGDVLPEFKLRLSTIDKLYTAFEPNVPPTPAANDPIQLICSHCDKPFTKYDFMCHLDEI